MFYSDKVRIACSISFEAHKDDKDKSGYPYIFHPFFLATQMDDEASTCVAFLHDVIEDHGDKYSFESLIEAGFDEKIITALKLLTHNDGSPYMDYIHRLKENEIARKVKIADLKHNLDTTRSGQKPRKYDLYIEALAYLEN